MSIRFGAVALTVVLLLAPSAGRATAGPIVFTFDDLSERATNAQVQRSLQNVWAGTTITGGQGRSTYLADGHVVGPVVDCDVLPLTLGTTTGGVWHPGYDGFVVNNPSGKSFTITLPEKVYAVSFDFQIFPDGSGQPPDLTFKADGGTVFTLFGRAPGSTADPKGMVPGVTLVPTYPHSPFSGLNRTEPVAQLLGSYSGQFPNGVQTLEFIDWPQMVGIDDLSVTTAAVPTPEPGTGLVLGLGLLALGAVRRARSGCPRRPDVL